MKFSKKIDVCRCDEDVPIKSIMYEPITSGSVITCSNYVNGKCLLDKKKCKIVTYERIDK